jgi:Regulator of ribonuclease activity B
MISNEGTKTMPISPNLNFDIDALFEHLIKNLSQDLSKPLEWHFTLRSTKKEVAKLERLGAALAKEFDIHFQAEVETWQNDRMSIGPPMLLAVRTEVLTPKDVKALAKRFEGLAKKHGFTYEGVSSFEPIDMNEVFGWLELDDAVWRLRHFTDTGLKEGADVPFVFALTARKPTALQKSAEKVKRWRNTWTEFIDADEEAGEVPMLLIRCAGKNDEAALKKRYKQVESIAKETKASLVGVQYFEDAHEGDAGQ